jgi:hypothetical protein
VKLFRLFVLFFFVTILNASESRAIALAKSLHLSAGSKAIVQWERIFASPRKMKRYKIDQLSQEDREILKEYLIDHAIDSDKPTIAGI